MEQQVSIKDITANPGPLGLYGFAMTTILLNIHNAGIYPISVMIMGMGIFYGGLAQFIAGLMEWKKGNQFPAIAFISYGAFWMSLVFIWAGPQMGLPKADPISMGFYLSLWGFFTLMNFIQTLNGNLTGKLLFGSLTLLFLLLAVSNFTGLAWVGTLAGIEGIICGLIAFYEATACMINHKFSKTVLPL